MSHDTTLRQAVEHLKEIQDSHLFTCEEDGDTRTRGSSGVGLSWKLWREIKLVVSWAVQQLTAQSAVTDITVGWPPHHEHPFVHGTLNGRDVWLTRSGSWTENEASEECSLAASDDLRRGRADEQLKQRDGIASAPPSTTIEPSHSP